MENPDADKKEFESILDEILSGSSTGDDDTFGAVAELEKNLPGLFEPRSVAQYKAELLEHDAKADVDHLTEFDVLMNDLTGVHAERMNEILGNMNQSNFVTNYQKLLKFAAPGIKAVDGEQHEVKQLTQINVTVVNSKDEIQ